MDNNLNMQNWMENTEFIDPAISIKSMPNQNSNLDRVDLSALLPQDIDMQTLVQMYQEEKQRSMMLENEIARITQAYMKSLKAQDDIKYWQDKCVELKIEVAVLTHDLKEIQDETKHKDSIEVANLKESIMKLENENTTLTKQKADELDNKITNLEDSLKRKDEVMNELRQQIDSLNGDLSSQKNEDGIIKNILELHDHKTMITVLYTAQTKVNQKLYEAMMKPNINDLSNGEATKLSNGQEKPQNSSAPFPFVGFNPFMFPNPNGHNFPMSPYPMFTTQPPTENGSKNSTRED